MNVDGGHAPDPTRYVFLCLVCPWQIQSSRKAKAAFGSSLELYMATCWVAEEHRRADHPDWTPPDELRRQLGMDEITGAIAGVELPRWWVDR